MSDPVYCSDGYTYERSSVKLIQPEVQIVGRNNALRLAICEFQRKYR
jgi:hypothetical protein